MNSMVWLMLISVTAVAALFLALAWFLVKIVSELELIGGQRKVYGIPASYLSKIRLGVRAIETQTGGLAPQVTALNTGLAAIGGGLHVVDENLAGLIAAVSRQEVP